MTAHLIHVGFPKTGTNFLRRWFRAHPQLAFEDGGIAGFRNVYGIASQDATPREGVLCRVTSQESLVVPHPYVGMTDIEWPFKYDPTTARLRACETMASIFPNAQILLLTRGFRSMIISSYSQGVRSGGALPLERLLATSKSENAWNYDATIALYARAFGTQNVIVMPYELLRDDADLFVRTLEDRLGLVHAGIATDRVNRSLSPVELYWYPRMTRVVRSLPIGSRLKRVYLRGTFANRFRLPIALLQKISPGVPVTADAIPESVVATFRGMADSLCGNPFYARYANDYLFTAE